MNQTNNKTALHVQKAPLLKSILTGAGIALIVILFFIVGAESDPDWPNLWRIKPLILTPLAGAFGGILFYFSNHLLQRIGLHKVVTIIISMLAYLIVLWLGTVLGLNGTMWD